MAVQQAKERQSVEARATAVAGQEEEEPDEVDEAEEEGDDEETLSPTQVIKLLQAAKEVTYITEFWDWYMKLDENTVVSRVSRRSMAVTTGAASKLDIFRKVFAKVVNLIGVRGVVGISLKIMQRWPFLRMPIKIVGSAFILSLSLVFFIWYFVSRPTRILNPIFKWLFDGVDFEVPEPLPE